MDELTLVLEPRFGTDLLQDTDILRRHGDIHHPDCSYCLTLSKSNDEISFGAGSFLQKLMDEDILQGRFEDKVIIFLPNTCL